jgi:transposase InsO family protein
LPLVEGVLEAGKKRLAGDTARVATLDGIGLRRQLKETLAEMRKFEIIDLAEESRSVGHRRSASRLVHSLPGGRSRSFGGWQAETAADLEQRSLTSSGRRSSVWPLSSRTRRLARRQLHRHERQLCVRGQRLSALEDHGLIASPVFILMNAADRFANPTTAPDQLWQTDFNYLVIGWGWFYLTKKGIFGGR